MIARSSESRAIHRRLLLAGAAIVAATVVGCALAIVMATATILGLNDRVGALLALEDAAKQLQLAIADQEMQAFDYAVARKKTSLDAMREAQARELEEYRQLEDAAVDPAIAAQAGRVRELATAWRSGWINPFLWAVDAGTTPTGEAAAGASARYDAPLKAALVDLGTMVERREVEVLAESRTMAWSIALLLAPGGVAAVILISATWVWVTRSVSGPLLRLNARAREVIGGADVPFAAERDDEIGELAVVLERLRIDAADRYRTARLDADRADVFNQLAELLSFAQDEPQLVDAAVRALARLAPTQRGEILLVNNSTNRLITSATWGDAPPEPGGPATIDRIDRCPGIRRATAYVALDLADPMAVHCPAHPAERGTVACVPMPALGTMVGVIHLERMEPRSLDPETIGVVARVAEQVALAIANARLMRTMESLAMTDPLTGLHNPRFFDGFLQQELAEASRDHEPTALLMLDVDHFKVFNDTHGHPAGDEALRTLARVLRASVRASDVIARYGGEEFVIALHRTGLEDARTVAEKTRAAVQQAVVEIGPGRYARITVSIGVATCVAGRVDPKGLVALADAALYQAKETGRNRVALAPPSEAELSAAAQRRSGRSVASATAAEAEASDAPAIARLPRARRAPRTERRAG